MQKKKLFFIAVNPILFYNGSINNHCAKNMKKSILVLFFSLAVLALSGCGQKTSEKPADIPTDQAEQAQQEQAGNESGNSISGTIKDLLGMGKSMKCESQYSENGYTAKATTYVSGKKSRTDSETTNDSGQKMANHSIIDGDWVYIWNDQSNKGTKMKLEEIENQQQPGQQTAEEEAPATEQMTDINEKVDFDCSSWNANESLLTPPSDITFTDISQQMQQLQNQSQNMLQNACQMCDMIPDETAKAECQKNCQ